MAVYIPCLQVSVPNAGIVRVLDTGMQLVVEGVRPGKQQHHDDLLSGPACQLCLPRVNGDEVGQSGSGLEPDGSVGVVQRLEECGLELGQEGLQHGAGLERRAELNKTTY